MRQSKLFSKTRKEGVKDEVSKNAELLIRAGFIHKEMAGVYTFLPLGLRVLNNIIAIIREEMNAVGGQEMLLSALQEKTLWEKTDRWSDDVVDVWFKTQLKNGTELGLGATQEEPITNMMKNHIASYKDLPRQAYQIQTKFRNELRAKSGVMRGREFIMKDLYTFSRDDAEHQELYDALKDAYVKVFDRCGLGDRTYVTFASGGMFAKYSHEFQTVSDAGEDIIYVDEEKKIAVNKEVLNDEVLTELGLNKDTLVEKKSIEVGNIFSLGTRFSEPLGLMYKDEDGTNKPVVMGSYGIGPARVMGAVVESLSDENGIVWPKEIAPFEVHLIEINKGNEEVSKQVEDIYNELTQRGITVLLDDRDANPGTKFADADLIGIPLRAVISEKTLEAGGIEVKKRTESEGKIVPEREFFESIK